MPKPKKKGLEALASEEVQAVAREGDRNPLLEEHMDALMTEIEPELQAVEETILDVQHQIRDFDNKQMLVAMQRVTMSGLKAEVGGRYHTLLEEKANLESQINARSRRVNGINIPRVSDANPIRARIAEIDNDLAAVERKVTNYWAGYFKVSVDEAFRLVREENEAYRQHKASS